MTFLIIVQLRVRLLYCYGLILLTLIIVYNRCLSIILLEYNIYTHNQLKKKTEEKKIRVRAGVLKQIITLYDF